MMLRPSSHEAAKLTCISLSLRAGLSEVVLFPQFPDFKSYRPILTRRPSCLNAEPANEFLVHDNHYILRRFALLQSRQDCSCFSSIFVRIVIKIDSDRIGTKQKSFDRREQLAILLLNLSALLENPFASSTQSPSFALSDPAAANHNFAVIEDCGLAGGDGALRLVEGDEDLVVGDPLHQS
jgi:hypothetical protein